MLYASVITDMAVPMEHAILVKLMRSCFAISCVHRSQTDSLKAGASPCQSSALIPGAVRGHPHHQVRSDLMLDDRKKPWKGVNITTVDKERAPRLMGYQTGIHSSWTEGLQWCQDTCSTA